MIRNKAGPISKDSFLLVSGLGNYNCFEVHVAHFNIDIFVIAPAEDLLFSVALVSALQLKFTNTHTRSSVKAVWKWQRHNLNMEQQQSLLENKWKCKQPNSDGLMVKPGIYAHHRDIDMTAFSQIISIS